MTPATASNKRSMKKYGQQILNGAPFLEGKRVGGVPNGCQGLPVTRMRRWHVCNAVDAGHKPDLLSGRATADPVVDAMADVIHRLAHCLLALAAIFRGCVLSGLDLRMNEAFAREDDPGKTCGLPCLACSIWNRADGFAPPLAKHLHLDANGTVRQ